MIKQFISLLFFLWFIPYTDAQILQLSRTIEWKSPEKSWQRDSLQKDHLVFSFTGATYSSGFLPAYNEYYPLDQVISNFDVHIDSCVVDTVRDISSYSGTAALADSFYIHVKSFINDKEPVLMLHIIPLRLNSSGGVDRLKSFRITIKYKPVAYKKKSGEIRWKTESVLNSGIWRKIGIKSSGVYKISYGELKNMGFTNPADVRLFGNGGAMLPEIYNGNVPDDLQEIPVFLNKGSDGVFNEGDNLVFYAEGPLCWYYNYSAQKFYHSKHLYSEEAYYYLTESTGGMKVNVQSSPAGITDKTVTSFIDYGVQEDNKNNLIQSGRNWYGDKLGITLNQNISFDFPDIDAASPVTIEGIVLARSSTSSAYTIKCNNTNIKSVIMSPVNLLDETANYADLRYFSATGTASSSAVAVTVTFEKNGNNGAEGWIDYIRLNARRNLIYRDAPLFFRDTLYSKKNKLLEFQIQNANSSTLLWDITDLHSIYQVTSSLNGNGLSFKALTDTLHQYVLFDPSKGLKSPDFLESNERIVANQNLHGLANSNMVIVAPSEFLSQAEELAAIHRDHDGLSVQIVTPSQIFNEFSSGIPDPAAIRNFMKMFYDRAGSTADKPKYLLLLGDGSYNNMVPKDGTVSSGVKNSNYILTYQSENSIREISSYVSDDYYGILDDGEDMESGLLDLGIGRFPVTTADEAQGIVNKIKRYISNAAMGDWRNNICFIGDDEDGNIHMSQADQLATYVDTSYPGYNLNKIYLDAFQQISTSSGPRYPDVNTAITNAINKGVLIMNYTGHGGPEGLAQEQILKHDEIKAWGNTNYPLFVTATCEFSRYDDYTEVTAGEDVLLNPNGGAISLLTTTRLVYSGPNFVLNKQFYYYVFTRDAQNNPLRLGDILRKAKNASGSDINKLSFTLLGDPALRLAYPKLSVKTLFINGKDAETLIDTLKAYSKVEVKGAVVDEAGNVNTSFNGEVTPSVFDKVQLVKTLANDYGEPFSFKLQNSLLFRGKATVTKGEFTFSFMVPREIAYNFDNGKISYYASDENGNDAAGNFRNFLIGGISSAAGVDTTGPDISLYLNDSNFKTGGISSQFPLLLANLADNSGINIAGTGVGHNIVATIDNNADMSFVLNSYFESEVDNYKSGTVMFKLPELTPGWHQMTLKAWDIFNNSSTASIRFNVIDSSRFIISKVYNYPNPFSESTTFVFEHNQPNKKMNAELQIFSITGKLVYSGNIDVQSEGYTSGPIFWDAKNTLGQKIEKGIYLFRFKVRYNNQTIYSESKKLILLE